MEELLKNLNPKQKEAVLATEGPVLILAGPGSGKTRILTHRIAYLIEKGVAPEQIIAATFTNKAAQEMKDRIAAMTMINGDSNHNHGLPLIGTFHSLAARILRVHTSKIGYLRNFTIFDENDSLALIKEVMKEVGVNPKQFPAGIMANAISRLKSDSITPEKYAEDENIHDLFPKTAHRVYAEYQRRIKESNAMDFDDLLMNTVALFQEHPDILKIYQDRFRYIHVDEYQDTDHTQYIFIRELAALHRNIAVVGDDAQAIYGWRNADYRNILNFEKDWPGAKIIVLDQNYRSTQMILDAARGVISRNTLQKEKRLWTENDTGEAIVVVPSRDERTEAELVVSQINSLLKERYTPKSFAVLYRTNAQSRALEEALLEHRIPYRIVGGIKFYQRKEIKDILAYIRYLLNPRDMLSLKRIINVPARGIGKAAFLSFLQNLRATPVLARFDTLINELRSWSDKDAAVPFLRRLLKKIGYLDYLADLSVNGEERWENVRELVSLAKKYDDIQPPGGLEKLLEDVTLMSEADRAESEKDAVNLMTLHAAKGLEFPVVFMVGMEEGIFPHSRSLRESDPRELEEERRLCYVGLTRAKEKVFLTFASRRTQFGAVQVNQPSRFLSEIPEHLLEFNKESTIEVSPL